MAKGATREREEQKGKDMGNQAHDGKARVRRNNNDNYGLENQQQ